MAASARAATLALLAVAAASAAGSTAAGGASTAASAAGGFSVFGYLPEWRYSGANFERLFAHLSHLAFFSIEPHPSGSGALYGLDRAPKRELAAEARLAARRHGTRLLLCVGGNGRSGGFSATVRDAKARRRFAKALVKFAVGLGLDGCDLNWEYPGYAFGSGYQDDASVKADWDGLAALVADVRAAFHATAGRGPGSGRDIVTLAYYPDGRQEAELKARGLDASADLLHAMTYDAPGAQHSPVSLAETAVRLARGASLRLDRVTLGLPFYGRSAEAGGDWTSYEDIVGKFAASRLSPADDEVAGIGFNGANTIAAKVRLALAEGLGGVMVWESGQDCREAPVTRDGRTHVKTCPDRGEGSWSLHAAVSRALRDAGAQRAFPPSAEAPAPLLRMRAADNAIEADL